MKNTAFALSLLCAASVAHAESASTKQSTDLQAESQSDAAKVATLPQNTPVEVLRRVGAWSEVKTSDGKTGWVRMMALKFNPDGSTQAPNSGKSGNVVGSLLAAGRTSGNATATTAVRGLDEEDLKNAHPNPAELDKAKTFAVNNRVARAFAGDTKLTVSKVDYLSDSAGSGRKSRSEDQ